MPSCCRTLIIVTMDSYVLVGLLLIGCACGDLQGKLVSKECLDCLCDKLTGCNLDRGCVAAGDCGMFAITKPFWIDAGSPKSQNSYNNDYSDFEACARDKACAELAIQRYMARYKRDCNNDGVIDCADFAAIHMYGPTGCLQQPNSDFVQSVQQCVLDSLTTYPGVDWKNNFV